MLPGKESELPSAEISGTIEQLSLAAVRCQLTASQLPPSSCRRMLSGILAAVWLWFRPHQYPRHLIVIGSIRSQIDQIWNAFWSGGVSNPLNA